jgi:uncharacterized protein
LAKALPYRRRDSDCGGPDGVRAMGDHLVATFAASLVGGLAGFAFGIVAAAVWLHFLPPAQTAALIVAFGLIVQGVTVWKLRKAIKPSRLVPFLMGGAIGVPIGAEVLRWASPASLRFGIGVILAAFSTYSLIHPKSAGHAKLLTDGSIGILNGALGGATGLAGIVLTIWCSVRDWPPPEQRAMFQPIGVSVFLMTALWLGGTGTIDRNTIQLVPKLDYRRWLSASGQASNCSGSWTKPASAGS